MKLLFKAMAAALFAMAMTPLMAGMLVTEAIGKVEMNGKAVGTLAQIPDDARLQVAAGAKLVVVDLATGREYILAGPHVYTSSASGPKAADGKPVPDKALPANNLAEVRVATGKLAQATLVMRGAPAARFPELVAPVRTAVVTLLPSMRWKPAASAVGYKLSLSRLDGSLVWELSTAQTEVTVPASHALQAGEPYAWRVEAMGPDGKLSDSSARFTVATAQAIANLELLKPEPDAPFNRKVLYAAQLREAGAVDEARRLWQALASERPDDRVLAAMAQ